MTSDFSGQKYPFRGHERVTNCTFKPGSEGSLEEAFVASWWIRNRVAAPLHMLDVTNVKFAPTTVTALRRFASSHSKSGF